MLEGIEPQGPAEIVDVDIRTWVEAARANPLLYRNRQVTEIVLATIGMTPSLAKTLVLKGGALMALAFKSERVTGDIDFSASADPADFDKMLAKEFNDQFPKVAIQLGYLDLICRVQRIEKRPRPQNFDRDHTVAFDDRLVDLRDRRRGHCFRDAGEQTFRAAKLLVDRVERFGAREGRQPIFEAAELLRDGYADHVGARRQELSNLHIGWA